MMDLRRRVNGNDHHYDNYDTTDNYELQRLRLLHDSRATALSLDCCTTTTSDRPKLQLLHDTERPLRASTAARHRTTSASLDRRTARCDYAAQSDNKLLTTSQTTMQHRLTTTTAIQNNAQTATTTQQLQTTPRHLPCYFALQATYRRIASRCVALATKVGDVA